jgi:DNA-cytosine methyltransferase
MNVLSLFDGCSGARLALTRANKKIDKYYTCEIDKYSSMVTKLNFPDTVALGDVTKINFEMLPKIDLLIGGSPCQDLSFAKGNGKGLDGERSGLFYKYFEALEVLRKKNPEIKFLLENVKMKKEWKDIISDKLGVQPIFINSADFSAQNRQRLYWTNVPVDEWIPCDDVLKDILEDGQVDREKSHCLDANYFKGGNLKSYFEKHRRQLVFNRCLQVGEADIKGRDVIKRVYSPEGKGPALTTCGGGHREPKVYVPPLQWRKLTPIECERLQTVPDNYTKCGQKETGEIVEISNTQRYKMLGNGFTISVIAHIIKNL